MRKIEISKRTRVENTDKQFLKQGIVAFQVVDFKVDYFGKIIETSHDTKIMKDGTQIVIGGCGFIKEGYKI